MIVVTGMHRSGTSLAALVLQALGADFGPDDSLYGADDHNADGYLERLEAVDLNSRMITGHERTSGKVSQIASQLGYLRRPDPASIATRANGCSTETAQLSEKLGDLFVKDPRFCLTLPAWQKSGNISGLVVALRHPSSSVRSLQKRNRLPPLLGHPFWRWHMESILPAIDEHTLVIHQSELLGVESDAEIERIRSWLHQVADIAADGDASKVVNRSLVHHEPDDEGVPVDSLELWRKLQEAPAWG